MAKVFYFEYKWGTARKFRPRVWRVGMADLGGGRVGMWRSVVAKGLGVESGAK